MLQSNYPVFEKGRILKIEMLEALRDMPLSIIHTKYNNFKDGILQGFHLSINENKICVTPGLLKVCNQILVMEQPVFIPYQAADELTRLVISIDAPEETPDMKQYSASIQFISEQPKKENQWELMRFKLKKGAYLRTAYQSFEDMITEYNTVNPMYRKNALDNQYGVSAEMLELFCFYAGKSKSDLPIDQMFCLQVFQNSSGITLDTIQYYISQRLKEEFNSTDPLKIHQKLSEILRIIRMNQQEVNPKGTRNRKLIVD
ncbi:hypothetical protein IW492_14960 [Enterococcus sp. BWB1-3]|uniref:hypothetical protein n=1 Tax=Enterococcus sp. BWB1-3 TaxID=2787713 RepID=UPI00192202BB|nr:hypothetical protein [Enterococcus sp. BWB1-3]MBL1230529.1 hypothetical protein [Enterococcus sp. BWB1-3]